MISIPDFVLKMHPHPQGRSSFKFPIGGLLKLEGIVGEDELRSPKQLDANGEECLIVIKNGGATKVTLGRGTSIESVVRTVNEHGVKETSRESPSTPTAAKTAHSPPPAILGRLLLTGGDASSAFLPPVPARLT